MRYRPLDNNHGEIRLLRLAPRRTPHGNDPPQCLIEYAQLAFAPSYVALSYVWGDMRDTVPIRVDGTDFAVTRNLAAALKRLETLGVDLVWADAICINQNDNEERGRQVLRMGAIYQTARMTFAWLPDGPSENSAICASIEEIKGLNGPRPGRHLLRSLMPLFQNPYWRRVWIIQELALSQDVEIIYGTCTLNLSHVQKFLSEHFLNMSKTTTSSPAVSHVWKIIELRNRVRDRDTPDLVKVLETTRLADASNILDRIYGLWGLVYDARSYIPEPSYEMSTWRLNTILTRAHIKNTESLDILHMLLPPEGNSREPAWVRDWLSKDAWLRHQTLDLWQPCYHYSGPVGQIEAHPGPWTAHHVVTHPGDNSGGKAEFRFGEDGRSLYISGVFIGNVTECTSTFKERSAPDDRKLPHEGEFLTRRQTWAALFFLFNFRTPRFRIYPSRTEIREQCEMAASCRHISAWLERNAGFDAYGRSLGEAVRGESKVLKCLFCLIPLCAAAAMLILGGLTWVSDTISPESHEGTIPTVMFAVGGCVAIAAGAGLWYCFGACFGLRPEERQFPCNHLESGRELVLDIMDLDMRLARGGFGLGWVHRDARPGDSIALVKGSRVPLVLRRREGGGWVVVGDAIVWRAMRGYLMERKMSMCEDIELR